MRRGHVFTLEAMGIFAAWMILLLLTWQESAHAMKTHAQEEDAEERERIAIELLDDLIQHHDLEPWKGCAAFSTEKRRELPYIVESPCLESLNKYPLPPGVTQLTLRTPGGVSEWTGEGGEWSACTIIRRPILLDGIIPAVVEASACD
ncbi:MAG: hypothetical protein AABW68_01180 [archaeon]